MPLAITRLDRTAADLHREARSGRTVARARRRLVIAASLEGCTRTQAAERAGMPRQTLRDRVHCYTRKGPPYAPELNPVEMIWRYLRRNTLAHRLYETDEDIVEACCQTWNCLIATPDTITTITARTWANVSA